MKHIIILSTILTTLFLWGCEDNTVKPEDGCTVSDGGMVELVYPEGGETFYIGDTVTIKYKIDSERIIDAGIDVMANGAEIGVSIPSKGIDVPTDQKYNCMSYEWVIGDENGDVNYKSENEVVLFIHLYGSMVVGKIFSDQSFTVKER